MNLARRRLAGGTAAAMLVSVALLAQSSVTSEATWNDTEWTHGGAIGTVGCEDAVGAFATRGEGRALSGSLLGIDLDDVVEAQGVEVTNNSERTRREPESAAPATPAPYAFADPLDIEALNTADVSLTRLLQLGLSTPAGVVGQYGSASPDGSAVGASGYVTSSGGINLDGNAGAYPDIASVQLSDLLNDLGLGALLADVADLELNIGAVAGQAELSGCTHAWNASRGVERDYLTSHADLGLTSPVVSSLGTTLSSTVGTLDSAVSGLLGNNSILNGVIEPVLQLVTGVLGTVTGLVGLRLVGSSTTARLVDVSVPLAPVRALIDGKISDDDGVLSISLAEGTVRIDTVALVGAAYADEPNPFPEGLNSLDPNTEPLKDERVLEELTTRLGDVLGSLIDDVDTALTDSVNGIRVNAEIRIPVQRCSLVGIAGLCVGTWQSAGDLLVKVDGTLEQLLANEPQTITIDTSALLGGLLGGVVTTLVNTVLGVLRPVLGALVGDIVLGAVGGLGSLPPDLMRELGTPVVSLVTTLYRNLLLDGVVSLTVNAQNDPTSGGPPPPDWRPGQPGAPPEGQYEVAALRIGVLDGLGPAGVRLYLGRASVGPSCSTATSSQPESACVQY